MLLDLTGRTALLTGASGGLGRAMAIRMGASGARVALLGRNAQTLEAAAAECRAAGAPAAETVVCDLADPDQVDRAAARTIDRLGGADILVNNAGTSFRKPFMELTRDDLTGDLDLKLTAWIRLSQLLVPCMKEKQWGRIINVVSINAKAPGGAGAPTTLSRSAGLTLTKIMAQELAPWNILVNALCVGRIKSGQWERRHAAEAPGKTYEEWLEPMAKTVPLGRVGEAEEFANVACFLASDAASYVTGSAINVDGGMSPVP